MWPDDLPRRPCRCGLGLTSGAFVLGSLLLAARVAAPIGSVILFVGARPRTRSQSGLWPASRRFILALVGTAMLALVAGAAVRLIGVSEHNALAAAAGLVFASLVWLPLTRR